MVDYLKTIDDDIYEEFVYEEMIETWRTTCVNVDTTHRCLLQCPFCMRQGDGGTQMVKDYRQIYGDAKPEDMKKIVDFLNPNRSAISFCGQISDPIYHSNFIELIESFQGSSFPRIEIHTNGSGKKDTFWKKLVDAIEPLEPSVKWFFGIDGIDQRSCIHRVGQDFESAFNAMKYVNSLKRPQDEVVWQFIPFKYNEHDIPKAIEMAKEIGVRFMMMKSGRFRMMNSPLSPPNNLDLVSYKRQSEVEYIE